MSQHHIECSISIPVPVGPDGKPNWTLGYKMLAYAEKASEKLAKSFSAEFGVPGVVASCRVRDGSPEPKYETIEEV